MAKTHSQWSASASARNMACPGSLALSGIVAPTTSIYAAWGTAMHELNETCVREGIPPSAFEGKVYEVDGFTIEVAQDMVDAAALCVDYIATLAGKPGAQITLEETFDLAPLNFPMQAGGTSDVVALLPDEECIEIVDYKGGKGKIVEVEGNTQLPHYGLGALLTHPTFPAKKVRLTIVQPRAPHPDGVIRSVEMDIADMVDFALDIEQAMEFSLEAMATLEGAPIEEWAAKWLNPGDQCTFCPAAGNCPALRARSQEMVALNWDDTPPSTVSIMSPEAVERDLEILGLVEHWIAERRAYAHQLAEGGHEFENWVLVEKTGHRKWNGTEKEAAVAIAAATGLEDIYTQKLKSPAGIEKMLGAGKSKIADLYHVPIIGKDLVRRSKAAGRRPAKSLVDSFFNTN